MGLLPSLKSREVIAALLRAGFRIIRQSGSHVRLQHPANPARQATVPQHSAPLPLWLMRAILRQAKLSIAELRTHLKNAFGLQSADFCSAAFSGLCVPLVRIAPAAVASQRNPLDFAYKAIFEMGSRKLLGRK